MKKFKIFFARLSNMDPEGIDSLSNTFLIKLMELFQLMLLLIPEQSWSTDHIEDNTFDREYVSYLSYMNLRITTIQDGLFYFVIALHLILMIIKVSIFKTESNRLTRMLSYYFLLLPYILYRPQLFVLFGQISKSNSSAVLCFSIISLCHLCSQRLMINYLFRSTGIENNNLIKRYSAIDAYHIDIIIETTLIYIYFTNNSDLIKYIKLVLIGALLIYKVTYNYYNNVFLYDYNMIHFSMHLVLLSNYVLLIINIASENNIFQNGSLVFYTLLLSPPVYCFGKQFYRITNVFNSQFDQESDDMKIYQIQLMFWLSKRSDNYIFKYSIIQNHIGQCLQCKSAQQVTLPMIIECYMQINHRNLTKFGEQMHILQFRYATDHLKKSLIGFFVLRRFESRAQLQSLYYIMNRDWLLEQAKQNIRSVLDVWDTAYGRIRPVDIVKFFVFSDECTQQMIQILEQKVRIWMQQLKGYKHTDDMKVDVLSLMIKIRDLNNKMNSQYKCRIDDSRNIKISKNLLEVKLASIFNLVILNDQCYSYLAELHIQEMLMLENDLPSQITNNKLLQNRIIVIGLSLIKSYGKLVGVNHVSISDFFGYSIQEAELIQTLSPLLPEYMRIYHESLVLNFLERGTSEVFFQFRDINGWTKAGFINGLKIQLVTNLDSLNDCILQGVIIETKHSYIIFNATGQIIGIDEILFADLVTHFDNSVTVLDFYQYCLMYLICPDLIEILKQPISEDLYTLQFIPQENIIQMHKKYLQNHNITRRRSSIRIETFVNNSTVQSSLQGSLNLQDLYQYAITGQTQLEKEQYIVDCFINERFILGVKYYSLKVIDIKRKKDIFEQSLVVNDQSENFKCDIEEFHESNELLIDTNRSIPNLNLKKIFSTPAMSIHEFREDDLLKEGQYKPISDTEPQNKIIMENEQNNRESSSSTGRNSTRTNYEIIKQFLHKQELDGFYMYIILNNSIVLISVIILLSVQIISYQEIANQTNSNAFNLNIPTRYNRYGLKSWHLGWLKALQALNVTNSSDFMMWENIFETGQVGTYMIPNMTGLYNIMISLEQSDLLPPQVFVQPFYSNKNVTWTEYISLMEINCHQVFQGRFIPMKQTYLFASRKYLDALMTLRYNILNIMSMNQLLLNSLQLVFYSYLNSSYQTQLEQLSIGCSLIVTFLLLQLKYWYKRQRNDQTLMLLLGRMSDLEADDQIKSAISMKEILKSQKAWKSFHPFDQNIDVKSTTHINHVVKSRGMQLNSKLENNNIRMWKCLTSIVIFGCCVFIYFFGGLILHVNQTNATLPTQELTIEFIQFNLRLDALYIFGTLIKTQQLIYNEFIKNGIYNETFLNTINDTQQLLNRFKNIHDSYQQYLPTVYDDLISQHIISQTNTTKLVQLLNDDSCKLLYSKLYFCQYITLGQAGFTKKYAAPFDIDNNVDIFQDGIIGMQAMTEIVISTNFHYELSNLQLNPNTTLLSKFINSKDFNNLFISYYSDAFRVVALFLDTIQYCMTSIIYTQRDNLVNYYISGGVLLCLLHILISILAIYKSQIQSKVLRLSILLLPYDMIYSQQTISTLRILN